MYKKVENFGELEKLRPFLPEHSLAIVSNDLKSYNCIVTISRSRKTKLGDFRPGMKKNPDRLSVNGDLNIYNFLITLLHEIAHMICWHKIGRNIKPHGKEWKKEFLILLDKYMTAKVFPDRIAYGIVECFFLKRKNSAHHCTVLRNILSEFDANGENCTTVDKLDYGDIFRTMDGKEFICLEKLRTRYKCQSSRNGKFYSIHGSCQIRRVG